MEVVRYKHSVNSGDLIASLPGIKYVYDELGKKAVIYQRLNMPADYAGQEHPIKSDGDAKVQVTMNKKQWELLKPLLLSQPYIHECEEWQGQEWDLDFDKIREGQFSTMPFGDIKRWVWYAYPTLACDLSKKWLYVEKIDGFEDKLIVNRTCRYRNPLITYYFLKKYEGSTIFAGTKEEYEVFITENNLKIPYLEVPDFLQLARAIASCKLFLGNQSMCYNIAEALKIKRIVEVRKETSNCVPAGADGYDFLQQSAVEIYVNKYMR